MTETIKIRNKEYKVKSVFARCDRCNAPIFVETEQGNHISISVIDNNTKCYCPDCGKKIMKYCCESFFENGETFNVDLDRIKVIFKHRINRFTLKFYVDCKYDIHKGKRPPMWGNYRELKFVINLNRFSCSQFSEQNLKDVLAVYAMRARHREKKDLLINDEFISWLFLKIRQEFENMNLGVEYMGL